MHFTSHSDVVFNVLLLTYVLLRCIGIFVNVKIINYSKKLNKPTHSEYLIYEGYPITTDIPRSQYTYF